MSREDGFAEAVSCTNSWRRTEKTGHGWPSNKILTQKEASSSHLS